MNRSETVDLCVIGAGISGLSLAAFASQQLSVCVVEQKDRVGGILQTKELGGALFDEAANGWLDSEPSVEELINLMGASSSITPANTEGATRFLVKDQQLHPLSPKLLLRSTPLLSWWQKIRALREYFWSPALKGEPSMAHFMKSRFGAGIIDNFLAPMCAGIYADTPESISVRAAFPNLWEMAHSGSIIRQLLARLKDKTRKTPHLTSMKHGTSQLCSDIAKHLTDHGHSIQTSTSAERIVYEQDKWTIYTSNGVIKAKGLAITTPAQPMANLLSEHFPTIGKSLQEIEYAPVAVVMQTFPIEAFSTPPRGFGALLSRSDQASGLLGILFSSHLYPNRCPQNVVMTRSILGGAIAPSLLEQSDVDLEKVALQAHRDIFQCPNLSPFQVHTVRWDKAIPRYQVGHWQRQQQCHQFHQSTPHLRLSGNHLFGVAVKDCIRIGKEHATHFISTLS